MKIRNIRWYPIKIKFLRSKYLRIKLIVLTILISVNDIKNIEVQHTHNLFLEVTYNYGLFASITLFIGFIALIIKNFSIKKDLSVFDKAWYVSAGLFLFIHLSDVTYYDLRISTCAWILFAGMCSIIKNKQIVKKNFSKNI